MASRRLLRHLDHVDHQRAEGLHRRAQVHEGATRCRAPRPSTSTRTSGWASASRSRPTWTCAASIAPDRFMWGSDYPHDEGTEPYTREHLRQVTQDVPEDELRRILGCQRGEALRLRPRRAGAAGRAVRPDVGGGAPAAAGVARAAEPRADPGPAQLLSRRARLTRAAFAAYAVARAASRPRSVPVPFRSKRPLSKERMETSWPGRLGAQRRDRALLLGPVGERVERVPAARVLVGDLVELVVGHVGRRPRPAPRAPRATTSRSAGSRTPSAMLSIPMSWRSCDARPGRR